MNLIMGCEATDFTNKDEGTDVRLVSKDNVCSETKGIEIILLCDLKKSSSP